MAAEQQLLGASLEPPCMHNVIVSGYDATSSDALQLGQI
jgi:hypothetical protein